MKKVGLLLFIIATMTSCASIQLTPKQTCLWGMNVYNTQYERFIRDTVKPDYVEDILRPPSFGSKQTLVITEEMLRTDLTEEKRESLITRKDILYDLFQAVQTCDKAIIAMEEPSEENTDDLIHLINRLLEDL